MMRVKDAALKSSTKEFEVMLHYLSWLGLDWIKVIGLFQLNKTNSYSRIKTKSHSRINRFNLISQKHKACKMTEYLVIIIFCHLISHLHDQVSSTSISPSWSSNSETIYMSNFPKGWLHM